jgi:hypothetical protein
MNMSILNGHVPAVCIRTYIMDMNMDMQHGHEHGHAAGYEHGHAA